MCSRFRSLYVFTGFCFFFLGFVLFIPVNIGGQRKQVISGLQVEFSILGALLIPVPSLSRSLNPFSANLESMKPDSVLDLHPIFDLPRNCLALV